MPARTPISTTIVVMQRSLLTKQRSLLTFGLIFVVTAELSAQAKRTVGEEDLATLKNASWIELATDGAALAYVTGRDLWLVSTKPGSVPRNLGTGLLPRWAPDGRRLLYLSDKSGALQLREIEIESKKDTALTNIAVGVSPRSTPAWSPDGRRILFTSPVKIGDTGSATTSTALANDKDSPLVLTNNTHPKLTLAGVLPEGNNMNRVPVPPPGTADQVFVLDVQSKQIEQLTADGLNHAARSWSPDSLSIVCIAMYPRTWAEYRTPRAELYAIDVATKQRRPLASPFLPVGAAFPQGINGGPRWSPDGSRIAYLAPATPYGHNTLFIVPAGGGAAVDAGAKLNRSLISFEWVGGARSLIVSFVNGSTVSLARLDVAIADVEQLTPGEANRRIMCASPTGAIAWQQSDARSQGVIWFKPSGAGEAYQLIDLNPQIKDWKLGEQEVVRWLSKDGEQLWGILIKPVDFQQGKKYPLIVDPYGGMVAVNDFKGISMLANQSHAMRGYAVFFPASRSFFAFNQHIKNIAFAQSAQGPAAGNALLEDVLSGVDELIARGLVDPQRLGLFSFSTGASAINYLLTRTTRFKVAVSVAGVSDWIHYFLLRDVDDWTIPDMMNGQTPFDDLQTYLSLSPIYHLDRVTTPLMLVIGDKDQRLLDHIYMFDGLRRLGREVVLVRYPAEGHGLASSAAIKDYWNRTNEFIDKYLKSGQMLEK